MLHAASSKWNAVLPQLLHQFKAHTLPFSVKFQHRPQHSAHPSATWKMQTYHLALRNQEEWQQKYDSNLSECSWFDQ
jgi:hypothetical protein